MKKKYLITTLLLLSVGVMARSAGQQSPYPNGPSPPTQRPAQQNMTQTTQASASDAHLSLLEGCVEGSRDNLTLTDAAGKVYHLRGDTAKLAEHIGQHVSIMGTETPEISPGAAGAQPTFTVKKVKIIASMCSTSR
jgi:hypothetical protein